MIEDELFVHTPKILDSDTYDINLVNGLDELTEIYEPKPSHIDAKFSRAIYLFFLHNYEYMSRLNVDSRFMIAGVIGEFEIFKAAIEQLESSVIITDSSGIIEYANPFFLKSTGFQAEDVIGKTPRLLKSEKQSVEFFEELWQTIIAGRTWHGELQNQKKNGESFWVNVSINPIKNDEGYITNYIGVYQDITKQKEAEHKLEKSQQLLNNIEKFTKTGRWEYDLINEEMFWTDQLYAIHGLDKDEVIDLKNKAFDEYTPEDASILMEATMKLMETGEGYDLTLQFINSAGKRRWTRSIANSVRNERGEIIRFFGSVRDITDEVEAQKEAVKKEESFSLILNNSEDVIFILSRDFTYKHVYGEIFDRYNIRDDFEGKTSIEIFGVEVGQQQLDYQKRAFLGEKVRYTWSTTTYTEELTSYETSLTPIYDDNGKVDFLLGVVRDISDLITVQEELSKTKDRFELALKGTRAGTWDWDIKTGEVIFNERWAEMLGYKLDELEPLNLQVWKDLTHPEDLNYALSSIEKFFSGVIPMYDIIIRMQHKNGDWVWVHDQGEVFEWDKDGKPTRMVGTHVDISNWMYDRQKLMESENRYRTLFEKSFDPNLIMKKGIILDCNSATIESLGYSNKEEVIGLSISDISQDEIDGVKTDTLIRQNSDELNREGHIRVEWIYKRKDGSFFPVEVSSTIINNHLEIDDRVTYVTWRDISKRREAEKVIRDSNEERGLLLAEIHHRVKNNLAIISGLMQLQMFNNKNEYDNQLLSKTINRIRSIALIHEQLYQSENFASVALDENISTQIDYIQNMYEDASKTINVDLDLDKIQVKIDLAIPIGLLINEILNNTYKYAFEGREEGNISIFLHQSNAKVDLIIADDGIGMSEQEYKHNTTLGRTLIDNLLLQLEADCNISMENGVSYHIKFKNK